MLRFGCLVLCLACFLLTLAPTRATLPATETKLRLGQWNIEWLGRPDMRGVNAPQEPEDLYRYIARAGVDLLTLNEISANTQTAEGPGNKTLEEVFWKLSERTDSRWKHVLFTKETGAADQDQLCGIAWNDKVVQRTDAPLKVPVRKKPQEKDYWTRHPHAVKFTTGPGKTDFVVITLHMKSNRGGDVTIAQRSAEARMLLSALAAVQNQFQDDDIILAGDTNMKAADEPGLKRYLALGFRDLNAADMPTWIQTIQFPAAPFDRFLVPDDQPEFRASQQKVHKDLPFENEKAYRQKCSDHYMVTMELTVTDDDD